MTRAALEHILRAAGSVTNLDDLIVVGSQAILGAFPEAPKELLASQEADIYPLSDPEKSDLITEGLGEDSRFQKTFGYFADGVSENTAILPEGWRDRLILVASPNTRGVRGWCLEPHDLAISKYVAGREKDLAFNAALARNKMVRPDILDERLAATPVDPRLRDLVAARIRRDHSDSSRRGIS
jgi:hypothetical protein